MAIQSLSVEEARRQVQHAGLAQWISDIALLTEPREIHIVDGSDEEWNAITDELVAHGTFVRLEKKPNSFWCVSDPDDVAAVIVSAQVDGRLTYTAA